MPSTAFASKKGRAVTARLIVRRVRDLNRQAALGQDELFPVWRCYAVFTDSVRAGPGRRPAHRDHAIIEQVFADVTDGPLADLPSVFFPANAAWITCAAIAHKLLRVAGSLAGLAYGKARSATLRRDLIAVAARTSRHGRGHITFAFPRRLAPRAGMDEPVHRGLRTTRRLGLTSPDPVTALSAASRPPSPRVHDSG